MSSEVVHVGGRTGGTFVLAGAEVAASAATLARPTVGKGTRVVTERAVAPPSTNAAELARSMGNTLHDALDFRLVLEPCAARPAARRALSAGYRQHLVAGLIASRDRGADTRRISDSRLHLDRGRER